MYVTEDMEVHLFVCPASRCTYGFTGHVTKAYVSDSNQIMVVYWSVYGDFSPILYFYYADSNKIVGGLTSDLFRGL